METYRSRVLGMVASGRSRGQGLVETALLFPVLLIVLSGLLEFGFLLNDYMVIQDACRNAARFGANNLYDNRDGVHDCSTTRDFYRQVGCVVGQELAQERPLVALDIGSGEDDVVVSVFSVEGGAGAHVSHRYPTGEGEAGWSQALDTPAWEERNQSSEYPNSAVNALLNGSAPSTGYVLVELFYSYDQKLKLPWITAFLDDPLLLHVYAFMPLSSAEPTATPIP